ISFSGGGIQRFNTDKDVFWDFMSPDIRKAMAFDSHTKTTLALSLAAARERFLDANDSKSASFFAPDQINSLLTMATNATGDILLKGLLFTEAEMVNGAFEALKDVQKLLAKMATAPTQAIKRFAEFGSDLTKTFNKNLSVYGNESLRT